jgi:hypothetical protein
MRLRVARKIVNAWHRIENRHSFATYKRAWKHLTKRRPAPPGQGYFMLIGGEGESF